MCMCVYLCGVLCMGVHKYVCVCSWECVHVGVSAHVFARVCMCMYVHIVSKILLCVHTLSTPVPNIPWYTHAPQAARSPRTH